MMVSKTSSVVTWQSIGAVIVAGMMVLAAAGCNSTPLSTYEKMRTGDDDAMAATGPMSWLKGDCHLHTVKSDGSGTPTATATTVKSLGYGFSILTDHNTTAGNAEFESQSNATFIGIGGEEVTRGDGHILAYGVSSTVPATGTPQQNIDAINNNNVGTSFCYIAHPMWSTSMTQGGDWEWHDWSVRGYVGLEVWNAYYPHNYHENYSVAAFAKWDELNNAGKHLYGITNTDAHASNAGNISGSPLGIGYGYNVVYAELTKPSILTALRTGTFYGSNGPVIDFTIDGVMMGRDLTISGTTLGSVYLSASNTTAITSVKLIKNGAVLQSFSPNTTSWSTTLTGIAAAPGDFFRMTVEGVDKFAYSNPIFIAGTPAPKMVPSKTTYAANEQITVVVSNNNGTGTPGAGGSATDRVALYEMGDVPSSSHAPTRWAYLDGDQTAPASPLVSGTINLAGVAEGSYFLAFLSQGGYSEICSRVSITVNSASATPGIAIAKNAFLPTEAITVSFVNNNGNGSPATGGTAADWIGIYKTGEVPGSPASTRWAYLDGDQSAPAAVVRNGSVSLAALPAGSYFVGFFSNNGYGEICPRINFFVSEPPTMTTSKASYTVGETVVVNFANNYGTGTPAAGGSPSDWIAIYDSTGGNGHWQYLDKTQICPTTTVRSGSLSFVNFAPGRYTARFLAYGSPDLDMQMAPAVVFTVTAAPQGPLFADDFNGHAAGTQPDGWLTSSGSFSIVTDGTARYQVDIKTAAARFAYPSMNATADMSVTSTIKVGKFYGTHAANVGITARYADAANTYVFYWTHAGDVWRIGKYVGGVWTTLASSASSSLATNTAVTVKFVVKGSSLQGYVNGVLTVSATDASLTSGKAGLYGWLVKNSFDDVVVSVP